MKQRYSDNSMLVASQRLLAPADGTHNMLLVPKGHFLEEVWIEVSNGAATGTAVFSAGIKGGGTDDLIVTTGADVTDGTCFSSKAARGGAKGEGLYLYTAKILTVTVELGESATQGDYIMYARYSNITR